MLSRRQLALALVAALLVLGLASCGGDDEESATEPATTQETQTTDTTAERTETETGSSTGATGDPADDPRAKEIVSCLEGKGLNVLVNSGSEVEANFHLVIDAGGGGVLYGFDDAAAAEAAEPKVKENQSGRDVEVRGDTVFAFFPEGQTLAVPEKYEQVRACVPA